MIAVIGCLSVVAGYLVVTVGKAGEDRKWPTIALCVVVAGLTAIGVAEAVS